MDEWRYKAWLHQQEMFRMLGNRLWDDLNDEKKNLADKLDSAFLVCYGADYHEKLQIKEIYNHVLKQAIELFANRHYSKYFSCTYIDWKNIDDDNSGIYFVIWLQDNKGSKICLDLNGRNYESWDDFVNNNILPKCYMMYPKNGRYPSGNSNDFVDIELKKSKACGIGVTVNKTVNVLSTVGGIVAGGVFLLNPVSATVMMGCVTTSVLSGGYSAGNCIYKLYDIHKHDGGLRMDSKTLFTAGELVLSAVGTAAIGAAAGAKALSSSGVVLSKGTMAYRLANSLTAISVFFSGVSCSFYVLHIIDKYYQKGKIAVEDVIILSKIIFFTYNIIVDRDVLLAAIRYLADSVSVNRIIDYCKRSANEMYCVVKKIVKFDSLNDINKIIKKIIPYFGVTIEKISNIGSLVSRTANIFDLSINAMTNNFDINLAFELIKQLQYLWNDFCNFKRDNKKAITDKFDEETVKFVNKWTQNDPIDFPKSLNIKEIETSKFEKKINTPLKIQNKISETIKILFCHLGSDYLRRPFEKRLYSELFKLMNFDTLRDNEYFMDKMNFFCTYFNSLFCKLMEFYNYEYFLVRHFDGEMEKKKFFEEFYGISNVYENVFFTAIKILNSNIEKFNKEFEKSVKSTKEEEEVKNRKIFEIDMQCYSSELTKEDYFQTAKNLIPYLEVKLNDSSTTFDHLNDVAVIKSNDNDFTMFFYTVIENDHAHGILLLIEDLTN